MLPISELLAAALRGTTAMARPAHAPTAGGVRRARARGVPLTAVFSVCLHCNMSCRHCYASAGKKSSPQELTTAEALKVLDELVAAGVRSVIYSGGEPLLRGDLFLLLEETAALGMEPLLWTNGVLVSPGIADRLQRVGVRYVGVSIDGRRELHDAYRDVEAGFDRALRALGLVRDAGVPTGLHMTLTRDTLSEVEALYAFAREAQVERFHVAHLVYSGKGRRLVDVDLSREQSRDVLERLFTLAYDALDDEGAPHIVTSANDSAGPFLLRWLERQLGAAGVAVVERLLREQGGNGAGEELIAIDPRGRVHPDPFWQHAVFGDLRKQSLQEALAHPLREELRRRAARLQGRCGGCRYLALCRGAHRERAIAVHGDLWAPDPACVLHDDEVAAALSLPAGPE